MQRRLLWAQHRQLLGCAGGLQGRTACPHSMPVQHAQQGNGPASGHSRRVPSARGPAAAPVALTHSALISRCACHCCCRLIEGLVEKSTLDGDEVRFLVDRAACCLNFRQGIATSIPMNQKHARGGCGEWVWVHEYPALHAALCAARCALLCMVHSACTSAAGPSCGRGAPSSALAPPCFCAISGHAFWTGLLHCFIQPMLCPPLALPPLLLGRCGA